MRIASARWAKVGALAAVMAALSGPVQAGTFVQLRLYNADDLLTAFIDNGEFSHLQILQAAYAEDTGFVDISSFIRPGDNHIWFTNINYEGVWSYAYELKVNGVMVDAESCGLLGVAGCNNNDTTVGLVYEKDPKVRPVPEPSAWALLLSGFAGVGAVLRRRRSRSALVAAG